MIALVDGINRIRLEQFRFAGGLWFQLFAFNFRLPGARFQLSVRAHIRRDDLSSGRTHIFAFSVN